IARDDNHRHRIAVVVVSEQNLIEHAFERLARMLSLTHANRITRNAARVQLGSIEASTWLRESAWFGDRSRTLTCGSGIFFRKITGEVRKSDFDRLPVAASE